MDSGESTRRRWLNILALCGVAVLLAAVTRLIGAVVDSGKLESGDAATWVGSVGGVVAALATVGTLVWAVRTTIEESRQNRRLAREFEGDRRAADAERRRSQAHRVFGSLVWLPSRDEEYYAGFDLIVGNTSNEPIYEFVAYLVWVQGFRLSHRRGSRAPQPRRQPIGGSHSFHRAVSFFWNSRKSTVLPTPRSPVTIIDCSDLDLSSLARSNSK